MADHHHHAPTADFADHEATYRGFLTLLKVGTAGSVITLALMFLFLTH
jgi:hypothetical protein